MGGAGRKETVAELKAMVGTLRQEMKVMEDTVTKYKSVADEVHGLRADIKALETKMERKVNLKCRCRIRSRVWLPASHAFWGMHDMRKR